MSLAGRGGVSVASRDARGGAGDGPLMMSPIVSRKRRSGGTSLVVVVLLVLGAVVTAIWLAPHKDLTAALTQGTPSLSEAKACLSAGDMRCAEADFNAYLQKYPSDASATAIMALTLTQDGRHHEAIRYYERAAKLGVSTYDFYANYAVSLNNEGRLDEAIKMNYAALKIVPSLVDVRGALADQLVRQGKPKDAVALLESFDQTLEDQGHPPYSRPRSARSGPRRAWPPSRRRPAPPSSRPPRRPCPG